MGLAFEQKIKSKRMTLTEFVKNNSGLTIEGNKLLIGDNFSLSDIPRLIQIFRTNNIEFGIHDIVHPSPTDPGAYIDYSLLMSESQDNWSMTMGNHAWSAGIYRIKESTIILQLENLIKNNKLSEIKVGNALFFSRKEVLEKSLSDEKNAELIILHSGTV
ncbi:hypothetical protein [Maribacter sp. 1_MG-2023]|uniref:hypothetical protein n=1 Tax=Maribacter sp. 1_MG-2023 TaxID=3062677 RepID=UPI0026E46C73|nr:hypothetical protein [Maribacter sp. 1_MG-2023]MDO6472313.1 hypothetical protein [Maribacter sp. 1_MG-2023]